MPEPIVKFAEAPLLTRTDPTCAACAVDVESDGDGYVCPTCGTSWPYDADEDEHGTLYEEWSGEDLDIAVTDPDSAWQTTIAIDRERRETRLNAILKRSTADAQ